MLTKTIVYVYSKQFQQKTNYKIVIKFHLLVPWKSLHY